MSKTQREAVYSATKAVLAENSIDFEDNSNIKDVMTDELRQSITSIIVEGFKAGEVEFKDTPENKEKLESEPKLKAYVSGLVSNWFRKDKRFNGNVKYVAANPGSRAGQGDATMKNLRLLKKQYESTGRETKVIDEAITKRANEIKASKAKNIEVDLDQIPAELKETLGL
jgi:hypothetical protein